MSTVTELQSWIAEAAGSVGPAVVGLGRGWGVGSGVVVADGRVLTNAHNVRGDELTVTFADDRREAGHVVATEPDRDLAAIEVDTGGVAPVPLLDGGAQPGIGTAVLALANPGGRGLRVTLGFVSSAPRSFRGPRGRRMPGGIEHSAPLPRGSSGGPLVDGAGRLLGLNTLRLEGGLILAVPADAARVDALFRGETAQRVRLGVALAPAHAARRLRGAVGLPERAGLLVRAVERESPAARAGVERGDLIVAAGERSVERLDDLYAALDALTPQDTLRLGVVRGTDEREVVVALAPHAPTAREV